MAINVSQPSATCYINKNGKVYTCFIYYNFATLHISLILMFVYYNYKERKKERKKNGASQI
jgi:hypothetical protein